MKLKTLTIKNIASYENATVEFDKAPLSQAPVILIAGEVGSGKSTILDAVTLALYGTTPRMENTNMKKGSKDIPELKNALAPNDIRQLMRLGAKESEVTLSFVGNDGKEYSATWSARITRNGTYTPARRSLLLPDGSTIDKQREFDARIIEITGLDFAQFCRTTMLAQGEFTRFLKSGDKDKAAILEKITGRGIYGEISSRIQLRTKSEKEKVDALQARVDAIAAELQMAPDEQPLDEQLARAEEIAGQKKVEESRLNDTAKLRAELLAGVQAEADALAEVQAARAAAESDETTAKRRTINDYDSTEAPRAALTRLRAARREREKAEGEIARDLRGVAVLKFFLAAEQSARTEAEAKIAEHEKESERFVPWTELTAQSETLNKQLAAWQSALAQQADAETKAADETAALAKPELEEKAKGEELSTLNDILATARSNRDELRSRLAAFDNLISRGDELGKLLRELQNVTNIARGIESDKESIATQKAQIEKLNAAIERRREDLAKYESEHDAAKAAFDEAAAAVELAARTVDEHTKALRATLSEGCTCPVCQQRVEKLPEADSYFDKLYNELLARRNEKKLACEQAQKRLSDTQMSNEVDGRTLATLTADKKKLESQIATKSSELDKALERLAAQTGGEPSLESIEAIARERNEALIADQSKYKLLKAQVDIAEGNLTQAEKLVRKAEQELKELQNLITDKKARIDLLRSTADNNKKAAEAAREEVANMSGAETLGELIQNSSDEVKSLAERFNKICKDEQANTAALNAARAALDDSRTRIDALNDTLDEMRQCLPESAEVAPAEAPGRDDTKPFVHDPAGRELLGSLRKAVSARSESLDEIARRTEAIDNFTAQNADITLERLEALDAAGAENIAAMRRSISEIDNALAQKKSRHEERSRALAHLRQKTENDPARELSDEALAESIALAAGEYEKQLKLCGELKARLNVNREKTRQLDAENAKLEIARREYRRWAALDEVLGSASGDKFRAIAQSFVLQSLLSAANIYLRRLSGRYELRGQSGTYNIDVADKLSGQAPRSANTVSGGESFLVSLALALALCDISPRLAVDILFIDEGFGTLSGRPLNDAVELLRTLHQKSGRRVAIISHIAELKSCIDVRLQAIPDPRTGATRLELQNSGA